MYDRTVFETLKDFYFNLKQEVRFERQYLLYVLQSLNDSDVVQVDAPCSVPVLDGGAVFRDRQPLQELQQVVMVVVDDAVYGRDTRHGVTYSGVT